MERQILHINVNNSFLLWTALDMLKNGYKSITRAGKMNLQKDIKFKDQE